MNLYRVGKISLFMVMLTLAAHTYGIRINLSPSVPVGLWCLKHGPLKKGEFILFCPANNSYSQLAKQKGYFSYGFCPGSLRPLIKKIVATKGDKVQVLSHVDVNGKAIKNSNVLNKDHTGNAIIKVFNSSILKENELFVLGTSEDSFDSRYFGLIQINQVIQKISPVWFINIKYSLKKF